LVLRDGQLSYEEAYVAGEEFYRKSKGTAR
jgi:hypothetical protein